MPAVQGVLALPGGLSWSTAGKDAGGTGGARGMIAKICGETVSGVCFALAARRDRPADEYCDIELGMR